MTLTAQQKIDLLLLTDERVIEIKINAFKAGLFDALDLFPKQVEALKVLGDDETDQLVYGGAAGGGKSWLGCEWLMWNCLAYPETKWFIARHFLSQIKKSTIYTFIKVAKKHRIKNW